jgi:hypothetical protein
MHDSSNVLRVQPSQTYNSFNGFYLNSVNT